MTQYGPEFFRKFADIITEAEQVNEISNDLRQWAHDERQADNDTDRNVVGDIASGRAPANAGIYKTPLSKAKEREQASRKKLTNNEKLNRQNAARTDNATAKRLGGGF
jgi:hypothetical protein